MALVILAYALCGAGLVIAAPLICGLRPVVVGCGNFYGLFLLFKCRIGEGRNILALALCFAGGRFNYAVNSIYGFGNCFGFVFGTCAGCGAGFVIAAPFIIYTPIVIYLPIYADVGHNISYVSSLNRAEVCAYSVIGKYSVPSVGSIRSHYGKFDVASGKSGCSLCRRGYGVFICGNKVILTAGSFNKGYTFRKLICNLVPCHKSGVIYAGKFCNRLIKSLKNNTYIVADICRASAARIVCYGICYLGGSYHLIGGFAVCCKLKNVIAFYKTCCGEASVFVFGNILPAHSFICGKLNFRHRAVKRCGKVKGCCIFKGVHRVIFGIPCVFHARSFQRKLACVLADSDDNKACTFGVGCAIGSRKVSSAYNINSVIAYFKNSYTC